MLHKHHRKRRSQGGSDDPVNIMHVTPDLHEWIHAHPERAYENGWLVKSWQEPEEIFFAEPSMSSGISSWTLTEDGWRQSVPVRVGEPSAQSSRSEHVPPAELSGAGTAICPKCKGSGKAEPKPEKLEKPRQRKTLGIRLPVDADENGIEVFESLLTVARDELKEQMGWKDSVPAYYVLVAVLYDWTTSRVASKEA